MDPQVVTIEGKYLFSPQEKANLSLELANKTCLKSEVDSQRKARMSDYTQQISQINSDIQTVSVNLVRGYEFRNYKCTVEKDFKKKLKTYRDITNGNIIDTRPLSQADYQIEMDEIKNSAEKRTTEQDKPDVKRAKKGTKENG